MVAERIRVREGAEATLGNIIFWPGIKRADFISGFGFALRRSTTSFNKAISKTVAERIRVSEGAEAT